MADKKESSKSRKDINYLITSHYSEDGKTFEELMEEVLKLTISKSR